MKSSDMQTKRQCRCLLKEAGEAELARNVETYVQNLSPEIRAEEILYRQRLAKCGECEHLLGGMCGKCGCYVEMRAAVKNARCPSEERLW